MPHEMATNNVPESDQPAKGTDIPAAGPTDSAVGRSHAQTSRERAVLELARRGRREVLPDLERIFDGQPRVWQTAGDLARLVEQGWIDQICGVNLLHGQAVRRHVEQLRSELAGPSASPLERLLADRAVACWLASQHGELALSVGGEAGVKVAQLRLRRAESANRRLLAAAKTLAAVRRLADGLKIEVRHTQAPPCPSTEPRANPTPDPERVSGGRLGRLFQGERASETQLVGAGVAQ